MRRLFDVYVVESCLIFSVPAIIAGLAVPMPGLVATSEVYGAMLGDLFALL